MLLICCCVFMTPCASISFCRQACRLDAGQSVADLRKKWCCVGAQNLMHIVYVVFGCCMVVVFFHTQNFFPEDRVFC